MPVAITCIHCGKVVQRLPSKSKPIPGKNLGRYCSHQCRNEYVKKRVILTCACCGKKVEVKQSRAKTFKYCSKACKHLGQSWTEIRTCKQCGKEFELKQWKTGPRQFCSKQCFHDSCKDHEERKCLFCGKSFSVRIKSKRQFCSRKCAGKYKRNRVIKTCLHCGSDFETTIIYSKRLSTCENCRGKSNRSEASKDLYDHIFPIFPDAEFSVMNLIQDHGHMEIDIWIPSKQIGIEYHGLLWHSEKNPYGSDPKRDHNKFLLCKNQGIRLVQVYSDDWDNRKDIFLDFFTGLSDYKKKKRVYHLTPHFVTCSIAQEFLDENHYLSGSKISGSEYIGLFSNNKLYGVSVFKKRGKNEFEWNRHAFKLGCRSWKPHKKCLDFFLQNKPGITITTFSDNRLHTGKIYEQLGFSKDGDVPPSYEYTNGKIRRHKFSFRVVAGTNEEEEALKRGFFRVWDSGKIRWKLIS